MTSRRLNAEFLTPAQLEEFGVENAAARQILIHSTAVIVNFDHIRFGRNIRIDPYAVLSCADLQFGDNIHVATGVGIFGAAAVRFEDFSNISAHSLVYSSNDDYSGAAMIGPTLPKAYTNVTSAPVRIGRHAIIGARSMVLPGSVVHEGAATGAGTLIKGELPPWTISVGAPARVVRQRLKDCLDLEARFLAERGEPG